MSNRMILEIPADVQMAIRLRAVKSGMTTGGVVAEAMRRVFGEDVEEVIRELEGAEP